MREKQRKEQRLTRGRSDVRGLQADRQALTERVACLEQEQAAASADLVTLQRLRKQHEELSSSHSSLAVKVGGWRGRGARRACQ